MSQATEQRPLLSPQASDLCVACGLCCDGSIYARVSLEPEEIEPAAAEGLEVFARDDKPFFKLGCPRLDGTACQIYERRPLRCRSFRCVLLHRLDTGDIQIDEAVAVATEARRLADHADAIDDRLESRASARVRWYRHLPSFAASSPGERAEPAWLLAMTALNLFLDRHFRKPHQRLIVEGGTAAPEVAERD